MPIDLDRLPGGAADLLRASTASCLIGQALAFKRLQQTAGMLFSGPSPSPAAVLDIARRKGDTALVYVIAVRAPVLQGGRAQCTIHLGLPTWPTRINDTNGKRQAHARSLRCQATRRYVSIKVVGLVGDTSRG